MALPDAIASKRVSPERPFLEKGHWLFLPCDQWFRGPCRSLELILAGSGPVSGVHSGAGGTVFRAPGLTQPWGHVLLETLSPPSTLA